jgi:predicted dehydrogenase
MRPLRIGVLSAAHGHAVGYLSHLARRGDVEASFADPDAPVDADRRGRGLAARLDAQWYDSAEELVDRVDGVVVCSENIRHHRDVLMALRSGVHVLCEKPLATSVADAREMVDLAEAAGLVLGIAHPVRQAPSYRHLAGRVRAGALGSLLSVLGTNNGMLPRDAAWFVDPDLSGGGALVDHVVHCADLVAGLCDAQPARVRAVANRILEQRPPTSVETGGIVTVEYADGLIASYDCSWSQPASAPVWGGLTLDVIGTAGRVTIDPFGPHVAGHAQGRPLWLGYGTDLDRAMLDDFVEAVRGRGAVAAPGRAAIGTVQVMTAALRSAAEGGAVVEVD